MSYRIPGTEIFLMGLDNNSAVCYAPLKNEICLIDKESYDCLCTLSPDRYNDELKNFIKELDVSVKSINGQREPSIGQTTKLSLIPNNICNLSCSYCYSASGRNNSRISLSDLEAGLNWFIDPTRIEGDFLSIFITGGGEPLATWDVTSHAIAYAYNLARQKNIRLHLSVITNGTLVTEDIIAFLKRHNCSVGVSFDVLEDIQSRNRGKYVIVRNNIKSLLGSGLNVMINSTVIPSSIKRLTEIVREVVREYPGVSQFTLEPATGISVFGTPGNMRVFYDDFIREYFNARRIAAEAGLNLRFTFDDSLRGITTRHCPGKFALTPSGSISVCHLVSSPAEPRFDDCVYGKISDGKVLIDEDKFAALYNRNLFFYPECVDCIAKWSCGGECFTRRCTYPPEYMAEVCRFNRKFIEHLLGEEVRNVSFA